MELQWAVASYGRRFPLMEAGVVRRSIHGVYIHDQDSQRPLLIGKGEIRPPIAILAGGPSRPRAHDVPESATILHQRRGEKWDDGIVVKVNTRRFSQLQLFVLSSVPASPVEQRYTCYSASQSPF